MWRKLNTHTQFWHLSEVCAHLRRAHTLTTRWFVNLQAITKTMKSNKEKREKHLPEQRTCWVQSRTVPMNAADADDAGAVRPWRIDHDWSGGGHVRRWQVDHRWLSAWSAEEEEEKGERRKEKDERSVRQTMAAVIECGAVPSTLHGWLATVW